MWFLIDIAVLVVSFIASISLCGSDSYGVLLTCTLCIYITYRLIMNRIKLGEMEKSFEMNKDMLQMEFHDLTKRLEQLTNQNEQPMPPAEPDKSSQTELKEND